MPLRALQTFTASNAWLTVAFVLLVSSQSAMGQLAEGERAVLAFDIDLRELWKAIPEDKKQISVLDASKIRRAYGAMSAPHAIEGFARNGVDSSPLDFECFVRIEFTSEEAANLGIARKEGDGLETITIGNDEYLRPQSTNTSVPSNLLIRRVSPTAMEIGTQTFLTRTNPNVFTKSLNEAWSKMARSEFRLAIDFQSSQHLLDEAIRGTQGGVPLPTQPLVMIAQSATVLQLEFNLSGKELLRLTATGKDVDATKQMHMMLSGMLQVIKHGVLQSLNTRDDLVKEVGTQVANGLACSIDGNNVKVTAPNVDGIANAIASMSGKPKAQEKNAMENTEKDAVEDLLRGLEIEPTEANKRALMEGVIEGFLDAGDER